MTKKNITSQLQAIREMCKDCVGGELGRIKICDHHLCSLVPLRMGKAVKKQWPLKLIKAYCLFCMGHTANDSASVKRERSMYVKACTEQECSLWNFRTGKSTNEGV